MKRIMKVYRLNRQGRLPIPKDVRDKMAWVDGELYDVYIPPKSKTIVIETSELQSNNNQCIYFKGRITIPIELRKIINITEHDRLQYSIDNNKLIVKKGE